MAVIDRAVMATIDNNKTQIRPTNLCRGVPFGVKKIYQPTGIASKAKKACI